MDLTGFFQNKRTKFYFFLNNFPLTYPLFTAKSAALPLTHVLFVISLLLMEVNSVPAVRVGNAALPVQPTGVPGFSTSPPGPLGWGGRYAILWLVYSSRPLGLFRVCSRWLLSWTGGFGSAGDSSCCLQLAITLPSGSQHQSTSLPTLQPA